MSVQYPGRVFQISSDGVDRMEAKKKNPKKYLNQKLPPPPPPAHQNRKSHAEFPILKSLQKTKQV